MRTLVVVAALILCVAAQAQGRPEFKPSEIYSRSIAATCTIIATENGAPVSLGSGFVISGDGLVATNRHVVGNASEVLVKCGQLSPVRARVAKIHASADLAVLRTNLRVSKPLVISPKEPAKLLGQPVYAIGNPEGLEGTISNGLISGVRHRDGVTLIQISAPISHGSSGGPVILGDGQVIGVATALSSEGQNLNFATPAVLLRDLTTANAQVVGASTAAQGAGNGALQAPSKGLEPWPEDLGSALLSRSFWAGLNWARLEDEPLIQALPLVDFDPRQHQLGDKRVLRKGPLPFRGAPADVMLLIDDNQVEYRHGLLHRVMDVTPESCRSSAEFLDSRLGQPGYSHDLSYPSKELGATILRKQWDIGSSRVSWECISFSPDDRKLDKPIGWMTVGGGHQSVERKDSEIAWIRCAVSIQVTTTDFNLRTVTEPSRQLPDIVLGLDDFKHQVYDNDNRAVGKAEFGEGRIKIVNADEKRTDEIFIDRRTGAYSDTRTFKSGRVRASVTGNCAKFDRKKLAF